MFSTMKFSVLASGSRGNCTYLESDRTAILIDCGISAKRIVCRLEEMGIAAQSLSAIVVTHEHRDHIAGISVLSRRFKIPVYANEATAQSIDNVYHLELFRSEHEFCVGRMNIRPFRISHDAVEPVGFSIFSEGLKYTHVTDFGKVTNLVRCSLRGSNAIVIESNHDPEMLQCCHYPWSVKQRIASSFGHLSNGAAASLLGENLHNDLNCIVLAHLSENSNCEKLAYKTTFGYLTPLGYRGSLMCASQAAATAMVDVAAENRVVQQMVVNI